MVAAKSWDDFKRELEPLLQDFDPYLREHILVALYARGADRLWHENLSEDEKRRPRQLRQLRLEAERKRKNAQSALKKLTKGPPPGQSKIPPSGNSNQMKSLVEQEISYLLSIEGSYIANIHPKFRTDAEKARGVHSSTLEHWKLIPGFGIAKINHMFIAWMEDYLKALVTKNGRHLGPTQITRIIKKTLEAFKVYTSEEAIKSARRRRK